MTFARFGVFHLLTCARGWLPATLVLATACTGGDTTTTDDATTQVETTEGPTTQNPSTTDVITTGPETTEDPTTESETEGPTTDSDSDSETDSETDSDSEKDSETDSDSETTSAPVCGDGMVEGSEACDDANDDDTDACLTTCELASCGDGFIQVDVEACDDGNDVDTDMCTNMCQEAVCGDGVVHEGVEECDDANELDTDDCLVGCLLPTCGDGFVHEGIEECDDANEENSDECVEGCLLATCGDGYLFEGTEGCDDSNTEPGDGCDDLCQTEVLQTCQALHNVDPNLPSGLYTIDPDGMDGEDPFEAYCDMTTEGGGWTLILNRHVDADNTGQTDINLKNGTFDNTRANNWNFDIDLFWESSSEVVFADRENDDCDNCEIAGYDAAILLARPDAPAWSGTCTTASQMIEVTKIVGPMAGMMGTGYQCGATLGWGDCSDLVCHYGVHHKNSSTDGQWAQNLWNEMHFPSQNSFYASFGDVNFFDGDAWCRSCGGGLPDLLNDSSSCCKSTMFNAKSRWTIWVR